MLFAKIQINTIKILYRFINTKLTCIMLGFYRILTIRKMCLYIKFNNVPVTGIKYRLLAFRLLYIGTMQPGNPNYT